MSNDLMLLTGATRFLGFRVLRHALEAGYIVRAAVRSESKGSAVRSHALLQKHKDQLIFVTVPDFLTEDAFDEAVKNPAIRGTIGVLESAQKAKTIQRIVITSSVLAIQPMTACFVSAVDETLTAESRLPDPQGPYPTAGFAYAASKVAALNQAERWVKTQSPSFDVIHFHPSFIWGGDDLAKKPADYESTSNGLIVKCALRQASTSETAPNNYNHVDDTAKLHVLALYSKIPGNQSYLQPTAEQMEQFPDAVEKGLLLNGDKGAITTIVSKFNAGKTEKTFGVKPASYEDLVVEIIGHYLELLEKDGRPRSPL